MKKVFLMFFAIVFVLPICCSCKNTEKLIGKWKLESQFFCETAEKSHFKLARLEFYSDGTVTVNDEFGTWKIVDDKLMILGKYGGQFFYQDSIVGEYECDGETLYFYNAIVDGEENKVDLEYIRDEEYSENSAEENNIQVENESIEPLSSTCDTVLLKATDKNGDTYELVGTQSETYDRVEIKLGIIKNNEWLVNLTTDMPFFDDSGLIYTGARSLSNSMQESGDLYDNYYRKFTYLGNGCFFMSKNSVDYSCDNLGIFYNCNTGKSINLYTYPVMKHSGFSLRYAKIYFGEDLQNPYDNKYLIALDFNYYLLDRDTLELVKIANEIPYNSIGAYSEGLFAVTKGDSCYFYDSTGTMVLDLSNFKIKYWDKICNFKDGKFTFYVENEAKTKFKVVVDRSGNVIEQTPEN